MRLKMPGIRFTRRLARILLGIVVFILIVFALAAWQVPEFTRRALTRDVAAMLGREVQVGKITFNPFTLTLRAHDIAVAQPGGAAPLLAVGETDVSVSWASLFWFAPVVDRLALFEPRVALVREGPTQFNFSDVQKKIEDMAAAQPAKPKSAEDDKLPRFSLNNLVLENGSITLNDQVTKRKQVIDDIGLGIPFISTFGYAADIDVLPRFHARINGSPFDLHGTARPFDKVPTSTLDVVFTGLALDQWADAWPAPLPVKLKQGLLDSDLHIAFEQPKDATPKLRIDGALSIRQLDLRDASDDPLLAWSSLNVRKVDLLPLEHKVGVGEVELLDPQIQTRRYADQRVNWLDIIDKLQRLGAGKKTTGPTQVSTVKTASAPALPQPGAAAPAADGAAAPAAPPKEAAAPAAAATSATSPATPASAPPASSPPASSSPPAAPAAPAASSSSATASKPAAPSAPAVSPAAVASGAAPGTAPAGAAATAPSAAPAPEPDAWQVSVGAINIGNGKLRLRDAGTQVDYTLQGLAVTLEQVQLPQPHDKPIQLWLTADNPDGAQLRGTGGIILQPLALNLDLRAAHLPLQPFANAVRTAAPVALLGGNVGVAAQVAVNDRNGVYAVQANNIKVDLNGISARDDGIKPPVTANLKSATLSVDKLALGPGQSAFKLASSGLLGDGALAAQGTFSLQPLAVNAKVDLSKLDLAQFAPYAAGSLNATVRSIAVGAKGDVSFAAANGATPMKASWKGDLEVLDLNLQDRVNRADFLAWKRLSMDGMALSVTGSKPVVNLGDVTLDNFYGNVLLNSEGRLNVMDLVAEPGKAGGSITQDTQTRAPATQDKPVAADRVEKSGTAANSEPSGSMPDISVHSVTLKNGRATFNDRFVKPNYTAELSDITGAITAVSSANPQPAKVNISGRVYRTAPLAISGIVQPFAKFLTLDIKASARGVDLPRFNTYASKYIGYPIKRGKLSLDVEYRIKNRQLQASNKVLLNQLTLGDKTNSKYATTLPVKLAVALLRDRNGNINIDLPISGSLDDPSFSVGGIILRVIGNLVVKAVTSPFSLLASAFGGGDELSYVAFAPGSAVLDAATKEKLAKLASALKDRPSLKMDITGRADPVTDEQGLRQSWVDARIRAAQARATGKSARLDASAPLSAADRAKYLETAYDNTKMDNKPRNFIGMAKSLPPDQMEALMLKAAPVGQDQLRKLADGRAQSVYEQLQADGAPADRIFVVAPELSADGVKDDGPPSRVEFSLKN